MLGLAPLTGVPLPFISYGSTNLIVLLAAWACCSTSPTAAASALQRAWQDRRGADVVIAAGGTAGHVVPALAVADALRADGAEVVFVGGERAERDLVPGRRLRAARSVAVDGLIARNPLKAAAAALKAVGARGAQRADPAPSRARRGAWAAAATSPGRSALAAVAAAHPARADRGRQPPRPDQPPAGAVRASASAWPSRSRAATATAISSPGGPSRRRSPTAPRRASSSASPTTRPSCSSSAARWARAAINLAAVEAFRRRARSASCTPPGPATSTTLARAGRRRAALRPAPLHRARSARRWRPATWSSRAPAARSSRSRPHGRPALLVPYPHATADHQTANARWMADARRGGRGRRRRADRASGCAPRSPRCCRPRRGWRRWPTRPRRWPGPTPRRPIAAEVLAR